MRRVKPADAPALFEALERIRQKIKGPPIHRVLLDGGFNASISQIPRFGLFTAWIFRARQSWMKLEHGMRNDAGPLAAATQAFLRWYFPRFLAKTFALARQDGFEADRIAGKWVGRDVAGAALTEIAIKGDWLGAAFWPLHWSAAAASPQPLGPFSVLRTLLAHPMVDEFARHSLRQTRIQLNGADDTQPVRQRLEIAPCLPAPGPGRY